MSGNAKRFSFKGFSLIEVITVLFIISVGLVGVLSLIVQNIQSQSFNKKNIVAYQLAQEGLELVRQNRDSNWLAGASWDAGLAEGTYFIDYRGKLLVYLQGIDPAKLYLDSNGFYIHDNSGNSSGNYSESGYSRTIKIVKVSADELSVEADVSWSDHGRNFTYVLDTLLYNWR